MGSKITSPPGYETDCSECGQLRILSELFACIFGERLWGLGQIHPCSLANACFFAQSSRKFGWGSPIPRVGFLSLSFSTPPYPCKRNTSLGNCHRGRRILPVPFWGLLYHCQITPKASISRTRSCVPLRALFPVFLSRHAYLWALRLSVFLSQHAFLSVFISWHTFISCLIWRLSSLQAILVSNITTGEKLIRDLKGKPPPASPAAASQESLPGPVPMPHSGLPWLRHYNLMLGVTQPSLM